MHDTRADTAADIHVGVMPQQGIDQGATGVAGGGVDHHASWFVDHNDVVVDVDHIEGDFFGDQGGVYGFWQLHANLVTPFEGFGCAGRFVVAGNMPLLNQALHGAPGQIGDGFGHKAVESLSDGAVIDYEQYTVIIMHSWDSLAVG